MRGAARTPVPPPQPAAVGVPVSVKVPLAATLNIEIVLARELTAYKNFLLGVIAKPVGEVPVTSGVSGPRVIAPVVPLICSKSTEPFCGSVT